MSTISAIVVYCLHKSVDSPDARRSIMIKTLRDAEFLSEEIWLALFLRTLVQADETSWMSGETQNVIMKITEI